jgi:DNA-binding response OmpR family regulator
MRFGRCIAGREAAMQSLPIILVVEDDQLIQSVVEEALQEGGFEVDLFSSARQAIEKLDNAGGKYRALVTDINLGRDEPDGWEVGRHAREIDPEFPVVYMSGDSAEAWASKGVPNSIMLSKPFAPAQLVTAVSQLLNAGTPST